MRAGRAVANLVGMMLFVQVILGGSSVFLGVPILYHLIWGTLTFAVLVAATVFGFRDYGSKSNLFRVGAASIVIFVVQGILGLISFGSSVAVVIHLTNAFVLAVVVTYMISFADSLDKSRPSTTSAAQPPVSQSSERV
jgi:heme A synthase